jgi:DNA polymerase-4
MDAFYVSVELVRRPELRGQPVVVGGAGQRGVVAAASYEARVYGIHSAMSSAKARRLCPDAIFLPGDHAHYGEVSARVMAIFRRYTPLVEPISLDEAFLDVSGARRLIGEPATIAARIRADVLDEEALTCSVGVAPNKFLAKLATEQAKPRPSAAGPLPGLGVKVVEVDEVQAFLDPLPIRALWGVGAATATRLDRLGVATVADLRRVPVDSLVRSLGKAHGRHLHELAHGRDPRVVQPNQDPKSVSHEETFGADLFEVRRIEAELVRMADAVGSRLRSAGRSGRTVNLKVRFGDFTTITRSVTLDTPTDSGTVIARSAKALMAVVDPSPGVRLLGVGVSGLATGAVSRQLSFDDLGRETPPDWRQTEAAMDTIRARFGASAIGPASTLGDSGLRTKRRGEQQWGPSPSPEAP